MKHQESDEQITLFQWAKYNEQVQPELKLLYHCPNGGKRNYKEAARFKAEGVKPGVPDVFLPVARGKFHGLYIEMKSEKGKVSDNQIWWISELKEQGYEVVVCFNWIEAKEEIEMYLKV